MERGEDFHLHLWFERDELVAKITGDLDLGGAALLERSCRALVVRAGSDPLTLDLANVRFLGAAGVSALIRLGAALPRGPEQLRLRSVPSEVSRVLDLCGVAARFGIDGGSACSSVLLAPPMHVVGLRWVQQ